MIYKMYNTRRMNDGLYEDFSFKVFTYILEITTMF